MIEEVGIVVELHGGRALVRTERSSACEGCGSAAFCRLSEGQDECTVEVQNPVHAGLGQKVRVGIPTASFLKGTFLLYLFPLVGLFTGMASGYLLAGSHFQGREDLFAGSGGVFGLLLFFVLQRLANRRFEENSRYRPVILEVLS